MTPAANRNRIEPTFKLEQREFKAKVEAALKNGGIKLMNKQGIGALDEAELNRLVKVCKAVRQGHKLAIGAPLAYLRVDGETICIKTFAGIRRELSKCYFKRENFRLFRNADKGITIEL